MSHRYRGRPHVAGNVLNIPNRGALHREERTQACVEWLEKQFAYAVALYGKEPVQHAFVLITGASLQRVRKQYGLRTAWRVAWKLAKMMAAD